jgi:hypothetical protein
VNDQSLLANRRLIARTPLTGVFKSNTLNYFAEEIGTVTIVTKDCRVLSFDAFYVPDLEENYFSTFVFGKRSNERFVICGNTCRLVFDSSEIAEATGDEESDAYLARFTVIVGLNHDDLQDGLAHGSLVLKPLDGSGQRVDAELAAVSPLRGCVHPSEPSGARKVAVSLTGRKSKS